MNEQARSIERTGQLAARPALIDVGDGSSVTYWTARFKCSWPQLHHAVKQVGGDSDKVRTFLGIE
jgi:Protein of unknown function (DUF3606)